MFRKDFTLFDKGFQNLLCGRDSRHIFSSGHCHGLRILLLSMTVTFSASLLVLLKNMIGVKVLSQNFLQSGMVNMDINISFTSQLTRKVKRC